LTILQIWSPEQFSVQLSQSHGIVVVVLVVVVLTDVVDVVVVAGSWQWQSPAA
jgi:hypothetical protein